MAKTLIGPRLRQLRLSREQTQAEMARALGVSASYVNLLENNRRSLSVPMLMTLSETYGVDWRDLTQDQSARQLNELRRVVQDPVFGDNAPDLQQLRAAVDHAPRLVEQFLTLHTAHRRTLDKIMALGEDGAGELLRSSPETVIHDFFRNHANHFPVLEVAAEAARAARPCTPEDHYAVLKARLVEDHGIRVVVHSIDEMEQAFRVYDTETGVVRLSQALDNNNRVFQLAHVLCLVEQGGTLDTLVAGARAATPQVAERLRVELANYFAAAYLMPYTPFLRVAGRARYDLDRIAAAFSVTFEQVCQRLTTLQREGARGVPFFFLRVDKAGNVTKRFNSTSFNLAEHGGACPVWRIHTAFYTPGVIMPQFVEMPDGERFFTISRTVHRPVFSRETQDRRLTLALGCAVEHADRIGYASAYNRDDPGIFGQIGISCHHCPRQACAQRAHQPLFVDLPIDANRRGSTRYES